MKIYFEKGINFVLLWFSISLFGVLGSILYAYTNFHVGISAALSVVLVALSTAHAFRERNLKNAEKLYKKENEGEEPSDENDSPIEPIEQVRNKAKEYSFFGRCIRFFWLVEYLESIRNGISKRPLLVIIVMSITSLCVVIFVYATSSVCICNWPNGL